jgi:hypothetical protein
MSLFFFLRVYELVLPASVEVLPYIRVDTKYSVLVMLGLLFIIAKLSRVWNK